MSMAADTTGAVDRAVVTVAIIAAVRVVRVDPAALAGVATVAVMVAAPVVVRAAGPAVDRVAADSAVVATVAAAVMAGVVVATVAAVAATAAVDTADPARPTTFTLPVVSSPQGGHGGPLSRSCSRPWSHASVGRGTRAWSPVRAVLVRPALRGVGAGPVDPGEKSVSGFREGTGNERPTLADGCVDVPSAGPFPERSWQSAG
ncbi:hypothetical protein [Novacetimonas cocois]|uniref:hypothetical protein n=1 Tax=Novacetimonas cocois TaxID=1747507 RepID=UPI0019812252